MTHSLIGLDEFASVTITVTVGSRVFTYDLPKIQNFEVDILRDPPRNPFKMGASIEEAHPIRSVTFSMRPFAIDEGGTVMWFKQPDVDRDRAIYRENKV